MGAVLVGPDSGEGRQALAAAQCVNYRTFRPARAVQLIGCRPCVGGRSAYPTTACCHPFVPPPPPPPPCRTASRASEGGRWRWDRATKRLHSGQPSTLPARYGDPRRSEDVLPSYTLGPALRQRPIRVPLPLPLPTLLVARLTLLAP